MTYDIIILGSGPAGLAAAVAARGRNKSVLVAGNPWQDSPLARAERVDNYPGLPGRTGLALLEEFYRHASGLGADFVVGKVLALLAWNGFSLTVGSQVHQGRALILAPGVVRAAKYPGEAEYLGRGVSYCATCDGMLYRNRPVTVVGLAPDAPQEANYLHSLGCQVVYVAPRQPQGLDETIPYVKAGRLAVRPSALCRSVHPPPCGGPHRPAARPGDRGGGHQGGPPHGHQRPRGLRRRRLHWRTPSGVQGGGRGSRGRPVRLRISGPAGPAPGRSHKMIQKKGKLL